MHKVELLYVDNDKRILDQKKYEIEYTLYTEGTVKGEQSLSGAISQNKAFQKINYLMESIIHKSIVYTPTQIPLMEKFFSDYDNNFLVLPDLSEATLLESLHSKLNALAGETTFVDFINMKDSSQNIGYSYINDDMDYDLPADNYWIGEFPFWQTPWWHRYDSTTFDNTGKDASEQQLVRDQRAENEIDTLTTLVFNEIDSEVESQLADKPEGQVVDLEDFKKIRQDRKWKPTLV
jgi:hypothetical protein